MSAQCSQILSNPMLFAVKSQISSDMLAFPNDNRQHLFAKQLQQQILLTNIYYFGKLKRIDWIKGTKNLADINFRRYLLKTLGICLKWFFNHAMNSRKWLQTFFMSNITHIGNSAYLFRMEYLKSLPYSLKKVHFMNF